MLQMPQEYDMRIDMNQYFSAFSFVDDDGTRRQLEPWKLGPGYRLRQTQSPVHEGGRILVDSDFYDQTPIRLTEHDKWIAYYRHTAGHIPYAVSKKNGEGALDGDDVGLERGGVGPDDEEGESEVEKEEVVVASKRGRGGRPSKAGTWYSA